MPESQSNTWPAPLLYHLWVNLVRRCCVPHSESYPQYGGRGITVCAAIRESFNYFVNLVGQRPAGYSIDRPDNNGGYWCGKCEECVQNARPLNIRWATAKEQANNTRKNVWITKDSETKTIAQWAEVLNVPNGTFHSRKHRGAKGEEILAPVRLVRKSIFTKNPPAASWTVRKRPRR